MVLLVFHFVPIKLLMRTLLNQYVPPTFLVAESILPLFTIRHTVGTLQFKKLCKRFIARHPYFFIEKLFFRKFRVFSVCFQKSDKIPSLTIEPEECLIMFPIFPLFHFNILILTSGEMPACCRFREYIKVYWVYSSNLTSNCIKSA